jgi:putative hydrolase of the HAD superfamily
MEGFMVEKLNLPVAQVPHLRQHYFKTYGTTLKGLQTHHKVDPLEFLQYVHDLPLDRLLKRDPALRTILQSLPQQKWICTNADRGHAQRIMDFLEISDCFQGVIDILETKFHPKPDNLFYLSALSRASNPSPPACVFFDDQERNLAPAQAMGLSTVLVRPNIQECPFATRIVPCLHDLPDNFPELWYNQSLHADQRKTRLGKRRYPNTGNQDD